MKRLFTIGAMVLFGFIAGMSHVRSEDKTSGGTTAPLLNPEEDYEVTLDTVLGLIDANTIAVGPVRFVIRYKVASSGSVVNSGASSFSVFSPGGWSALGSEMDYAVGALTVHDGKLIAGGSFTTAGGVAANHIASWDGSSWSALESGINLGVSALTVYNGNLIAGGYFTTAGGANANYIASWDGTAWSSLGSGMNSSVLALTVYDGKLLAGGQFTAAGGTSANRIAAWDGTAWSPLGSGMNNPVSTLTVYDGKLIVGGYFTAAGGTSANNIASWDGTAWAPLGSGMSGYVYALTVYNGNLIAGGMFTTAGGTSANRIASWDGTAWSPLGSGMSAAVGALTVHDGKLIAGGSFTTAGGLAANRMASWDGSSWSALGSGMNSTPRGLTVYDSKLIVGGNFSAAGGVAANYIASWENQATWTPAASDKAGLSWRCLVDDCNFRPLQVDGVTPDTLGLGFFARERGLPPGFNEMVMHIDIVTHAEDVGATICLDSVSSLAIPWQWYCGETAITPSWSGQRCFTIGACQSGQDSDGDGWVDDCDYCPNDPDNDEDADLICAGEDNCPTAFNPAQEDFDVNGVGDVCDGDSDADGIPDDGDLSGIPGDNPCSGGAIDPCSIVCDDNCPDLANPLQRDSDADGVGDACTAPVAAFGVHNTCGFQPFIANFFDASTPQSDEGVDSWFWEFGDGGTSTDQNPTHEYAAGDYNVRLTVTNGAYQPSSSEIPDFIHVYPALDFTADHTRVPYGYPVTLSANLGNTAGFDFLHYYWIVGDQWSDDATPVFYLGEGSHDVLLILDYQCSGESMRTIIVDKNDYIEVWGYVEAALAASPRCGEAPLAVSFVDQSLSTAGIDTWYWEFGDGQTSTEQNPVHYYTTAGAYNVRLTVSSAGNVNKCKKEGFIIVGDAFSADFMVYWDEANLGDYVAFCPYIGCVEGAQFEWTFGDGTTSTECAPLHQYSEVGSYDVSLRITLSLGNCNYSDLKERSVVVRDLQAVFSYEPTRLGRHQPIQFYDKSIGTPGAWSWDFGDGSQSTEQNPTHAYEDAGTYAVSLRVTDGLISDSARRFVEVLDERADLQIEVMNSALKPGFPTHMDTYYTNMGTVTLTNTVMWVEPSALFSLAYIGVRDQRAGTYSGYELIGNRIVIPLGTVAPTDRYGGLLLIWGILSESSQIGDLLPFKYGYSSDQLSDSGSVSHPINGSIDPNDKLAFPGGNALTADIGSDERIQYLIQFENKPEATAEATYIMVIDTLDPNLDWSTFAFNSVSHPETLVKQEFNSFTGVITWFFENIMLPPNHNPPEGEGYVSYSIAPKSGLPDGTNISNSAYIKFDYNAWLFSPEEGVPIVRTIRLSCCAGRVGDANGSGDDIPTIGDISVMIDAKFITGTCDGIIGCLAEADINQSGGVAPTCDDITIGDISMLIDCLFITGEPPFVRNNCAQ